MPQLPRKRGFLLLGLPLNLFAPSDTPPCRAPPVVFSCSFALFPPSGFWTASQSLSQSLAFRFHQPVFTPSLTLTDCYFPSHTLFSLLAYFSCRSFCIFCSLAAWAFRGALSFCPPPPLSLQRFNYGLLLLPFLCCCFCCQSEFTPPPLQSPPPATFGK